MIGKIRSLPYQKIAKTVHGEMEQDKRRPFQENSSPDEKNNKSKDTSLEVSEKELTFWVKELNLLECYASNDLHFDMNFEGRYYVVRLIDNKGHTLQEYLPVQLRALYWQLKEDKDESKKGTILNLNC